MVAFSGFGSRDPGRGDPDMSCRRRHGQEQLFDDPGVVRYFDTFDPETETEVERNYFKIFEILLKKNVFGCRNSYSLP